MGSSSHFPIQDKLREKSDYHRWKMSLDLTLKEQEVLDHVRGRIVEPPSNAFVTARNKWTKGEFKAKKIIRDSIDKRLVAYVSELTTSKEIYNRLVSLFKVNDVNQVLFLKNKLKEIKKGKDESMQAYFLRITKIKNDLLSIGEVIPNRELTITTLRGLPSEWYIFRTTLLNNNVILGFEELMARCIQEETRMEEQEITAFRGNPTAFSCHAKRRNNFESKSKGKQDEYYLPAALSTTAPPDSLGNWLIDSGASRHFTGYKEALSNLIEKETNLEIVLGHNSKYLVKGVGNVTLQLNQGNTIHLQEVLYLPDLKKNLVSISAMEDKGYKVAFIDGKVCVWIKKFRDTFTLGFRVDSLYQVRGNPLGVMSCVTSLQSKLWHQRFAHLHYKALPNVRQMVTGMPEFKVEKEGKHEVFSWFRHFKALIENQTKKKIKILRTNNGTEYESNEFHDFCKEVRIKRETTTPYTPKQNGMAKRKNRTIVEVICNMLHDQRLSKFLWAKAANTVVYVQNRCPHQALGSKTPEEMFTGKKPDVSHFRIFGSPIYFHVPKEKRNKLGASGKKGIFVGYSENTKSYRIYVVGQREVEISHDVTFDEDMALSKVDNLPILTKSGEADTRKLEEKEDETMLDAEEPMDPIDPPLQEPSSSRKRPSWLRGTLDDAEGHIAPRGTFRESKKPTRYQGYLTLMSTIIQNEPSSFAKAVKHQVWKDVVTEEYESIMKNDVWDVVPRP
eukprot:PITA_16640